MSTFDPGDNDFVRAVARLPYCNPFVADRVSLEKQALGESYVEVGDVWHYEAGLDANPNLRMIQQRLTGLLPRAREVLRQEAPPFSERELYRDLTLYYLYTTYEASFLELTLGQDSTARRRATFYDRFETDARECLLDPELGIPETVEVPLLFAWCFQIRRAFHHIFRSIVGGSPAAANLRAEIWRSVFTRDMLRYRRGLYLRMGDITTLVTGPSGTGKELVARAIGLSRFVPFIPSNREFAEDFQEAFYALNLSALSPTLLESELFGHQRGSFTGAVRDRVGWFEVCPSLGAVFLDEIGEVDLAIQVKLLRVLQTRTFHRLGDTRDRHFRGKLIAATNRDPATEMKNGRMREDFYYRLCSDLITTPSLHEQLSASPEELPRIVLAVTAALVGREEAVALADEVVAWIDRELGRHYPWPGNFRELEQCVRNVMIRGRYSPSQGVATHPLEELFASIRASSIDAETLLRRYITLVFFRTGSYQGAARRLELDRRTVRAKIDRQWLARLEMERGHQSPS